MIDLYQELIVNVCIKDLIWVKLNLLRRFWLYSVDLEFAIFGINIDGRYK